MTPATTHSDIAWAAEGWMRGLGTGPLAELRRMTSELPAPAAWHLIALHNIGPGDRALWCEAFRLMAALIPRGDPKTRPDAKRRVRLGEALADGADERWKPERDSNGEAIPLVSQARMQQLLAARGSARVDLLSRACSMIGRALPPGTGIRPDDIAAALLHPEDSARLAHPYYRRLVVLPRDAAAQKDNDA